MTRRLLWFAGLYAAGVCVVALVSFGLPLMIGM